MDNYGLIMTDKANKSTIQLDSYMFQTITMFKLNTRLNLKSPSGVNVGGNKYSLTVTHEQIGLRESVVLSWPLDLTQYWNYAISGNTITITYDYEQIYNYITSNDFPSLSSFGYNFENNKPVLGQVDYHFIVGVF